MAQLYCTLPMQYLRDTTGSFKLTYNTLVTAVVSAYNINGYGDFSDPNLSGAVIQTAPTAMAAVAKGSLTS